MDDSVYLFATVIYTAFSLWLLYWLISTLRQTRRTSAAAVAILGEVGQKLNSIHSDLEGIHSRLDALAHDMSSLKAANAVAAE